MARSETPLTEITKQLSTAQIKESRELSFAGQHLKLNTENEAAALVAAIKSAGTDLECLCLEGNTLGQDAAKAIGKALEGCPKLKRALWKDLFTGRSKAEIPGALRFLTGGIMLSQARLVELDLSDNAFGPIGAEALLVFLGSEAAWSLETLKLNNNGLGPAGSQMLFGALSKSVKESRSKKKQDSGMPLKVLVCGRNRLENVGATALGELLKELGTLEQLQLPQNGIFKKGIEALAQGLAYNKRLRVLDLNDNILTPAGAKSIAQAIRNFQDLEELNLGDCLLKTKGALAIAEVLKEGHTKLKNVYLGHNEVSREGGLAIVKALSNKEFLDLLELDGNHFGSEGIAEMEVAMEAAGKIDKLCAFSDDEGSPSEGEEEEEEEGEEQEDEETGESSTPGEAGDFLAAPTASKLKQLGKNRAHKLVEHVQAEHSGSEEAYLDAFIKLSSVVSSEEADSVREMAQSCADALLRTAFQSAMDRNGVPDLVNQLLVHLGLMKSECDKGKKDSLPSPTGALLLLSDLVKQKYFAPLARDALVLLLSKPNPRLEAPNERKACSHLLRVLYQA